MYPNSASRVAAAISNVRLLQHAANPPPTTGKSSVVVVHEGGKSTSWNLDAKGTPQCTGVPMHLLTHLTSTVHIGTPVNNICLRRAERGCWCIRRPFQTSTKHEWSKSGREGRSQPLPPLPCAASSEGPEFFGWRPRLRVKFWLAPKVGFGPDGFRRRRGLGLWPTPRLQLCIINSDTVLVV